MVSFSQYNIMVLYTKVYKTPDVETSTNRGMLANTGVNGIRYLVATGVLMCC